MCELEHTAAPFESSAGISDGTRRAKQKFTFFFCKFRSFHLEKHLGCVSIILLAQLSTASSAAAPSMLGTGEKPSGGGKACAEITGEQSWGIFL